MKDKIEEILEKYDVETIKLVGVNDPTTMYVGEESTGILEELSTLIQEERKEAIRGFVDTLPNYIEMTDGVHSVVRHIPIQDEVRKIMETYLQSLEERN